MAMFPKARITDIVVQELDDELLVYDSSRHRAMSLNSVSAKIWRHCTGENDVDAIARAADLPKEMVTLGVNRLASNHLVDGRFADKANPSRRALMKYGAAASLPVIFAIVAPPAISAASACIPDNGIFTLMSTNTNDCFTPVNFNMCCSQSIKTTATDGISTVTCTCGTLIVP